MDNESKVKELIGKLPRSFITEKGSVYTYDVQGRTKRFKTATNETFGKMGITIFIETSAENRKKIMDAYEGRKGKLSFHIVEVQNEIPVEIYDLGQIADPENLRFGVLSSEKNKWLFAEKASLNPKLGSIVYEQSLPKNPGEKSWVHLGHEVTKINY